MEFTVSLPLNRYMIVDIPAKPKHDFKEGSVWVIRGLEYNIERLIWQAGLQRVDYIPDA